MVANLFTSATVEAREPSELPSWLFSYLRGLDQEVYAEPVPGAWVGKSFTKAMREIYADHGVLLIGVFLQDYPTVVLSPGRHCHTPQPVPARTPTSAGTRS